MSTRMNPGPFDGHAAALPDEPMFVLLARDPDAPVMVQTWAKHRLYLIGRGSRPAEDKAQAEHALTIAASMDSWRRANDGRWRQAPPTPTTASTAEMRRALADWSSRNPTDGHARLVALVLQDLEARL